MSRTLRARLRALNTALSTSDTIHRAARGAARGAGRVGAHVATVALILSAPAAAYAGPGESAVLSVNDLGTVITNLQRAIMAVLWSLAGLYAVIGALYRTTAGGDPEQVSKGNAALRNAAIGAGLGVLAPVLLQIVKGIVGG